MLEFDWGDRTHDRSWFAEQLGRCLLPAKPQEALWCRGDVDETAVETVLVQGADRFEYWCGKRFAVSNRYFAFHYLAAWLPGYLALRSWRHAAEAVPYLSPPDMLRVTFGARLLDGHVHRWSIYLACTHCTPRCAVKSEKKLNFRWQMYLACWNTPIITVLPFSL